MSETLNKYKKMILDYLVNELDDASRLDFEEALAHSKELQKECAAQRVVIEKVASAPQCSYDPDLNNIIMSRVGGGAARKKLSLRLSYCAAAAVVLIAVGLNWLREPVVEPITVPKMATNDAVNWLVESQESTGAWDAQRWGGQRTFDVGLTGLALLALQGNEAPAVKKSQDKAVKFLIDHQNNDGLFGESSATALYNHALAMMALLETSNNSKDKQIDKQIDKNIEKGLRFMVVNQNTSGGWGYLGALGTENTSVTLWQLNVLSLAKKIGYDSVDMPLKRGNAWLVEHINESGRVKYNDDQDSPYGHESLTAMSSYYLRLFEEKEISILPSVAPFVKNPKEQINFYRDFFLVSAADIEKIESHRVLAGIRDTQVEGGAQKGSWRPDDVWGAAGGRVYSTAMAALSLQVTDRSYRTLAMFKR